MCTIGPWCWEPERPPYQSDCAHQRLDVTDVKVRRYSPANDASAMSPAVAEDRTASRFPSPRSCPRRRISSPRASDILASRKAASTRSAARSRSACSCRMSGLEAKPECEYRTCNHHVENRQVPFTPDGSVDRADGRSNANHGYEQIRSTCRVHMFAPSTADVLDGGTRATAEFVRDAAKSGESRHRFVPQRSVNGRYSWSFCLLLAIRIVTLTRSTQIGNPRPTGSEIIGITIRITAAT
jgi:hypothetical protein